MEAGWEVGVRESGRESGREGGRESGIEERRKGRRNIECTCTQMYNILACTVPMYKLRYTCKYYTFICTFVYMSRHVHTCIHACTPLELTNVHV